MPNVLDSLNLDDLRAVVAVVETSSVSLAAKRLGVTKSVVSKRVSELESRLGQKLFRRLPRKLEITEVGQRFYARVRSLLQDWESAVNEVRGVESQVQGRLRIAAPIEFGVRYLGPVLAPILREHPGLEVSIDLDDRTVDLLGAGYDLGIRIGSSSSPSLIQKRLASIELWIAASPAYLRQHGTPQTRKDLAMHLCVGYAHLNAGQVWNFQPERGGRIEPHRVATRFVANNGELMRLAAEAGLGLVMLPDFLLAPSLKSGSLVRVLKAERVVPNPLNALFPKDRQRHVALRLIVDGLAKALKNPPWRR